MVTPIPKVYREASAMKRHMTEGKTYCIKRVKRETTDVIIELETCDNGNDDCTWYEWRFMAAEQRLTDAEVESAVPMPDDLENFSTRFFK